MVAFLVCILVFDSRNFFPFNYKWPQLTSRLPPPLTFPTASHLPISGFPSEGVENITCKSIFFFLIFPLYLRCPFLLPFFFLLSTFPFQYLCLLSFFLSFSLFNTVPLSFIISAPFFQIVLFFYHIWAIKSNATGLCQFDRVQMHFIRPYLNISNFEHPTFPFPPFFHPLVIHLSFLPSSPNTSITIPSFLPLF